MRVRGLLVFAVVGTVACFDSGGPPRAGALTATVESPNGDEGGAVVLLLGEGVVGVSAAGETEVYSATSTDATRAVLINPLGGVLTFRVELRDTERPPSVLFRQVAAPDDELRDDLSGYRLVWSP